MGVLAAGVTCINKHTYEGYIHNTDHIYFQSGGLRPPTGPPGASRLLDAFQILELDIWTQGPNLADIYSFEVHVSMLVLLKTHIKWVPHKIPGKDAVNGLCY